MAKKRDGQKRAAKVAARRRRRSGDTRNQQHLTPEQWDAQLADLAAGMSPHDPFRAELAAARELGYVVNSEDRGRHTASELAEWDRAVERHGVTLGVLGDLEGDDDASDEMLDDISDQVRAVVVATVEQRDPDIARAWYARLVDADEHVSDEEDRSPGQWFSDLALTARLLRVGLINESDGLAERVVAWVAELGESAPALERLAAALLDEPQDVAAVEPCAEQLDEDYLPAMVWLLAGAVAVAGDGDIRWLDALDPGE